MLEQRRLDYLKAMGITQWMPRKPLESAPEPRWWPTQQAANSDESQGTALAPMIPETVSTPVQEPVSEKPKLTLVENTPPMAVAVQPVPEFRLFFTLCHLPVVWVCSEPSLLEPLQNFIFSLQKNTLQKTCHLFDPVEFKWPFLQSSQEDQSLAVAMQALKMQWQVFQSTQPVQAISLDDNSRHWLQQAEISSWLHFTSINDLLSSAANKRQLWLALTELLNR